MQKPFKPLLVAALLVCLPVLAKQVSTPNLPNASPAPVQNGDLLVGTRSGVTYNMSWPPASFPAGAVTLGSVTTTDPSVQGDFSTGFYTSGANRVDVAVGGVNVTDWSPSGLGFVTATSAISSFTGVHMPVANSLALTVTGSDAVVIAQNGGVIFGSPTGGNEGAGTINAAGGVWSNGTQLQNGNFTAGTNITITGSWPSLTFNATSGGSGTVNSGTANRLAYYPATAAAVSGSPLVSVTTGGLTLNGLNAISMPDNGLDTTSFAAGPGALATYATTTGNNYAAGLNALNLLTTGLNNVAVGSNALSKETVVGGEVAIGSGALQNSIQTVTTSGNTAVGYLALNSLSSGTANVAMGYKAMNTGAVNAFNNVVVGYGAAPGALSNNTVIGAGAAGSMGTAGASNTIIGATAGQGITFGGANICVGVSACGATVNAGQLVAIGNNAASHASSGTFLGYQVGLTNAGGGILIGTDSTTDTPLSGGSSELSIGTGVKGGNFDTGIGHLALHATTTNGNASVAVGYQALTALTNGVSNTAVGYQAGDAGTAVTTGTQNTFIGYQAQSTSATATNRTALGYQAISTADNDVVLGNSSVATIHAQVTSITGISDRRHKKNIESINLGLDFVMGLKPVSYRLRDSDYIEHLGFIAQDAELALPAPYRSVVDKRDPNNRLALLEIENNAEGTYEMNYGELIAPLVRAVQEQQQEITSLRAGHAVLSGHPCLFGLLVCAE